MEPTVYLRAIAALGAVVGLVALLAWVLRRFGAGGVRQLRTGKDRQVRVLETCHIDARHKMVLIEYGRARHLVMLHPHGVTLIDKDSPASDPHTEDVSPSPASADASRAEGREPAIG